MAAIVAPGVCRFTVNQTFAGQPVANIIDMRIDTTGSVISRHDAILDQAAKIIDGWDDRIRISQADDLSCNSVSWVDLDEADGETGERSVTSATTWPAVGGGGSAPFSANVAVLITKTLEQSSRNRRNGRMYLCGGAETWTTAGAPNQVDAATRTTLNSNLALFLSGITSENGAFGYDSDMCVVHTRNAGTPENPDIVFDGNSDVLSLTVQPLLATQRRRLR